MREIGLRNESHAAQRAPGHRRLGTGVFAGATRAWTAMPCAACVALVAHFERHDDARCPPLNRIAVPYFEVGFDFRLHAEGREA